MRLLKHLPVLLLALSCATAPASRQDDFAYPMLPARLLADSLAETCAVCVRDLRERAYRLLEKEFVPGTVVRASTARPFVKMPGGAGRFTMDGFHERVPYRKDGKGADISLPLVLFRFHTAPDHLVGVAVKDYTPAGTAELFRKVARDGRFTGAATILRFSYGDGPSFSYSPSENIIFVHCRLHMTGAPD
jgi:hypothetical protein